MATPKPGRPTTLTLALQRRICAHLRLGVTIGVAARAEGVSERTAHDWLAVGRERPEDEPYGTFAAAVDRAAARGVLALVSISLRGGKGSSAALFHLERRFRSDYGPVQKLEHSGPDGSPMRIGPSLDDKLDLLSVDELRAIARGVPVRGVTIETESQMTEVLERLPDADLELIAFGKNGKPREDDGGSKS